MFHRPDSRTIIEKTFFILFLFLEEEFLNALEEYEKCLFSHIIGHDIRKS